MDINCIQAKEEAKKCNLVFVKDSITNQPYLIKGKNKPSCKMSINNRNFWEDSDYYGPKATENVNDCIKRLSQKKDGQPYNRYYMKYTNCNGEVQENIDHQNPMRLPRNDFQYEYTGCYTDNSSRNLKNGPGYMGGPFDIKKCLKECRYSKYVALQDGGGSCFCDDQIKGQKRSFAECNKGDKQGFGKGNSWRNAVYRNDKYNTSQYPIEQYNYTPWTYMGNKEKELNWLLKHNIKCDNKGYLNSINFKPYSSKWFYYKNKCINHDKKKIMRNYSTFPRYHRNPKINNLKSHEIKCNRGLLNRMQLKKSGNNIRYDYTCNTGVKTKNCTQHFTPFSKVPGGSLQNAGRDCWNSCGRRGGLCNWCGSGKCCRQNWHNRYVRDSTCKPNEGGRRDHVCVAHKHPQKVNDLKSQLNCPGKKGISKIKMENLVVKNCGSIVGETIKLIKYIEGRPGCIYNMWSKMIARDTGDNIRFDRWPPGRPGDNRYWGEWGSDERFTIYPIYENGQVTDRIIMKGGKHNQNCGRQRGKSKILCKGNQGDIARNNDGSVQELQLHLVGGKFNPSLGAWPVYITEIDKFGKNKRWVIPGKERHGAEVHTWGRDPKGDIFIIGNPRSVKQYDGIMNGCHRELPEGTVVPGHRFSYTCCDAEQGDGKDVPNEIRKVSLPPFREIPELASATFIDNSFEPNFRWALFAYGNQGNVGNYLDRNSGDFNEGRQNSAILDARHLLNKPGKGQMIIAWYRNGKPNGYIREYQNIIKIQLVPGQINLNGRTGPAGNGPNVGSHHTQFSTRARLKGQPSYNTATGHHIKELHGLPSSLFTRNDSFGVEYGRRYGLVTSRGNLQLDWGPDGQSFAAVYIGRDRDGYITPWSTRHGYVLSTISLWVKL